MSKIRKTFEGDQLYYHIYNRGVEKREIFLNDNDRKRFLLLLLILQGDISVNHLSRLASEFGQHSMLAIRDIVPDILKTRMVALVSFVLMPNHFHLILKEEKENGLSKFMQRFGNSYTKYFNTKYNRNGHLFGSRFQRRLVDSNDYLLHLSAYIHRNPRELKGWKNKESKYPWSSYQDYTAVNRWGQLISHDIITGQFSSTKEYADFVKTSLAKLSEKELANMANIEC